MEIDFLSKSRFGFLQAWDRSYFLENLSGVETDCSMIGAARWVFEQALSQARYRGFTVHGRCVLEQKMYFILRGTP